MKTLVVLSGAMRSFERCLPTLHWHVFRHLPNPSFVVSTDPDENAHKVELLRQKYPNSKIAVDTTPQPKLVVHDGDHHLHAPYAISVPPEKVIGQLWRLQQSWHFAEAQGMVIEELGLVVRCRPDLFFHSFCAHAVGNGRFIFGARTPWWGRFGGINDRFALLEDGSARAYFNTFDALNGLIDDGCPLHPESLLKASLELYGHEVDDTLRAEFSTLRTDGTMRPPEISPIDIAHLAASSHD